ncbi:glycosyltransferase family 4 protein [Microvirga sp. VF16]|uniref:glycosyltransferase family 4 protein n=1 Tax=Microvirga sp. VF16 TaxID=2807101 RepID=UPI00193DA956|nr:glycosyltransferase family 4 protein [Microvirga sp. VF16]QRM35597.1 glycosyltransferase family 4 protein [Microvirga sp. VF16]
MRMIILSHGHPELSAGGAERAAYSLFQRLKQDATIDEVVFVARAEHQAIGHSANLGSFRGRPDEILVAPPPVDGFTFQSFGYDVLKQLVDELVGSIKPDVVHIHHFLLWGVEIFELFQQAGVKVVFTAHEYAAICSNYGQMVKVDGRLCYAASPAECGLCFPATSAGKFFVRNTILKTMFDHIDEFIAPSEFLKDRYVAWGVPAERIHVIENLLDAGVLARGQARLAEAPDEISEASDDEAHQRVVFGYFGQINPFKGIDLLLQAAASLPEEIRQSIEIRIHGENKHYRDTEFGKRVDELLADTKDVVRQMGSYRNEDVSDLMSVCDWIIMPSIWWENSPVVIQEARIAGRPLICANIGGMVEKIDSSTDLLFPARSPGALAELMRKIVRQRIKPSPQRLNDLAQSRSSADDIHFARHQALYTNLHQPSGWLRATGSAGR